jgi:hypothetical protein
MEDSCFNGQRLRLLTVVDEYTRESLANQINQSAITFYWSYTLTGLARLSDESCFCLDIKFTVISCSSRSPERV